MFLQNHSNIKFNELRILENFKKEVKSEIDKSLQYNGQVTVVGSDGKESKYSITSKMVRVLIPRGTKSSEIAALEKELGNIKGVKLSIEEYMEKKKVQQENKEPENKEPENKE